MNEHQVKNAFRHLQDDVTRSVDPERRLAEITVRRAPGRSAVLAFAAGAAVVLVLGAIFLALQPGTDTNTVPPATQTTGEPTTETTPTTTETTRPTGVTVLPDLLPGMILVANPEFAAGSPVDGIVPVVTSGIATVGVDVDRVLSDMNGGAFIQVGDTVGWVRPDLPAINLFSATDLPTTEPVEIWLEDVTAVAGETNILFIVAGGENEQRYEEVWRYEVGTGATDRLYHTGAYEGTIRRASLENNVLVVTRWAEGFSWFEFFTADGEPIGVANPKPDIAELPMLVDQGVLSPDGAVLVYLESDTYAPENGSWPVAVVVFDLRSGMETRRVVVDLGDWYPGHMDYDTLGVVIGREQHYDIVPTSGPPLAVTLGESAAEIREVELSGVPSLVK